MTFRNTKTIRQHLSSYYIGNMEFTNHSNVIFGKPPLTDMSILRDRIYGIISFRSKKKMLRTDARGIIAMMTNQHPFRDRTIVNLPRYAMRRSTFRSAFWTMDYSVAIRHRHSTTGPKPAIFGFIHFGPKSFFERDAAPTSATTEFASLSLYRKRFSFKFFPTSLTVKNWHILNYTQDGVKVQYAST